MTSLKPDWIFAFCPSVNWRSSSILGPTASGGLFLMTRLVAFPRRGKESTGSRSASMQPIVRRKDNSIIRSDIQPTAIYMEARFLELQQRKADTSCLFDFNNNHK